MNGRTGGTIAKRHIACAVLRDTAHPTPVGVGLIGALLEGRLRSRCHSAEVEETDTGHTARADREVADQRFMGACTREVAVTQTEHQPIADGVVAVAVGWKTTQLRYAVTV